MSRFNKHTILCRYLITFYEMISSLSLCFFSISIRDCIAALKNAPKGDLGSFFVSFFLCFFFTFGSVRD